MAQFSWIQLISIPSSLLRAILIQRYLQVLFEYDEKHIVGIYSESIIISTFLLSCPNLARQHFGIHLNLVQGSCDLILQELLHVDALASAAVRRDGGSRADTADVCEIRKVCRAMESLAGDVADVGEEQLRQNPAATARHDVWRCAKGESEQLFGWNKLAPEVRTVEFASL